ncbi:predicted protein [Phaeodactylum tricornutum CCAP 1055/1]|uniref:Uncharacterized protein n=1 Tax=Phaeodactylum tricornutum (strain CCAP 1055/1) TaxID=556484 RepID=B7FZJ1_PHATC|nr:predicted protein [Phaeodactylum tricornutum CCAP 1055/1]EEC48347.1 predicted protein [Phaeodactylum tricornutum CCAP 1055/1]|eukprot:XP_002180156.1 predicted protein [Phaeodactylum tricornutum CCAP 1055/1]
MWKKLFQQWLLVVAITRNMASAFAFQPQHRRRSESHHLRTGSVQQKRPSSFVGSHAPYTSSRTTLKGIVNPDSFFTDDEWHPHDPAFTTPQLLAGVWDQIAHAGTMSKGETNTVIYPQIQDKFTPRYLNLLMGHLDFCKDVCDHFGISTALVPYQKDGKIVGFTVKSFRNSESKEDEYEFGYDPFWDDGTDFDNLYAGVDDDDMAKDPYPAIEVVVPDDDEDIIDITKAWVGKMMTDMGLCPFTAGPEQAGLPMGNVHYEVDRSTGVEEMYAKYWHEVVRVEQNKEKDISTTLLIVPEFMRDNVELFESFSNTLTQPLTALDVEDLLQLVFFHPQWVFRDGNARAGEAQAGNYARRSPWPMINILRTSQVRAAQKGIPTGLVYKQNEKTLSSLGVGQLETMLRLRDWSGIADFKVNRREYDALKIAQDYQRTGKLSEEDMSLASDSTPAANKIDRSQVEQGNLVNVLLQALEKRLGKSEGGVISTLSGPETSATAMAGDVLIEELDRIASRGTTPIANVEEIVPSKTEPIQLEEDQVVRQDTEKEGVPKELELARKKRTEAARRAMLDDIDEEPSASGREAIGGDPLTDALFGRGGIPDVADDDELKGVDPSSLF